ncbi:hypothetical protein K488DRAFT_75034 [Vararia minispora EC-137]|uniref:Uncharacterized protein n=1 Tax=Vararia minispora EC-137 TaxID=1314806 RepID=A0ACB8Q4Z1_9AGAM|nr:hypothetical protein K488DRAFT_75034 [Vararia minispora EC-137]
MNFGHCATGQLGTTKSSSGAGISQAGLMGMHKSACCWTEQSGKTQNFKLKSQKKMGKDSILGSSPFPSPFPFCISFDMSEGLSKISPFVEGQYSCRECEMAVWLHYKGWYDVVSGALSPPAAPPAAGAPSEAYTNWKDIDSHSAGAIILSISEEKRSTVQDDEHSGSALWSALKSHYVQTRP